MEISWGLSKPLQEANLSWLPQETWALTLLASNKPDAEWTSTWPFVNPETPEKASGQHHTHQDPKESKHLERCQGKGKEGERKSRKAGSQSDEASSICVWILVSGAIVCCPDQTKCSVWKKKKWLLLRVSGTCSPVLKGWGLIFVCTELKEGSKRAISAPRRKENRSPSTENISAWHNVQAHWHARKSISLRLSRGIPALLCAVPAVWPWVNHLASLRIKHPSYQRPSVELSEHW